MLVSVTEAARRLGIGHAAVSRQVARFESEGLLQRGAKGQFDFDAFKQLRDGILNPLMARHAGERPAAPEPSAPPAAPPAHVAALGKARTDDKVYTAELKRLELLERTGRLCDRESVAAAGADAARALVELLENRRRALAEEIVALTNADDVEARLAAADRQLIALLREAAARQASERPPVDLEAVA